MKSTKLYWRDSGLMHALLRAGDRHALLARPWVGASWEGFAIGQILGALHAAGQPIEAFFFRTSDGHELDLVLERPAGRWAIEIKLTADPSPADTARLDKTADMIDAARRFLVSQTPRVIEGQRTVSRNLAWLLDRL